MNANAMRAGNWLSRNKLWVSLAVLGGALYYIDPLNWREKNRKTVLVVNPPSIETTHRG